MSHRPRESKGPSHRTGLVAVLLLAVVALGAVFPACREPVVDSGVQGEVRISPVSPVEQPGVDNSAPHSATLLVKKSGSDKVVAEATSAADGSFRIFLAPGAYVLEPVNGDPVPFAAPQSFTVDSGRFTTLRVDYDSGIR